MSCLCSAQSKLLPCTIMNSSHNKNKMMTVVVVVMVISWCFKPEQVIGTLPNFKPRASGSKVCVLDLPITVSCLCFYDVLLNL